jgi:hypothetical protein
MQPTLMNPKSTITNTITHGLAHIERARGYLEEAQLSDDWVRRMSERALLLEAHTDQQVSLRADPVL